MLPVILLMTGIRLIRNIGPDAVSLREARIIGSDDGDGYQHLGIEKPLRQSVRHVIVSPFRVKV